MTTDHEQKLRERRSKAAFKRGCFICGSKNAWIHLAPGERKAMCLYEKQCKRRLRATLTKGSAR